jgi:hypothetical protein
MHLTELLHKTMEEELPNIHKKRLRNLTGACEATIGHNNLYLTGLDRALINSNKESSNIQKIDRLLGNGSLQAERDSFYRMMISKLIRNNRRAWIHIDWTCINSVTNLYALRASLSMPGRSIVIYEACYPKKNENNHTTHKAFLKKLKTLLPESTRPIIVTDAGFRALWFAHVLQLGWDFVGRLRNKNAVCKQNAADWHLSSTYFEYATAKPTCMGPHLLTQEDRVPVNLVLYKGKNQVKSTHYKKKSYASKGKRRCVKASKEPWILVTSIKEAVLNPMLIVTIYHQRMRIEENIRDTKCSHYGLGLKNSLTRCAQRMNILLLIAALITFAAWLAGLFTKFKGKTADFQAHSAKVTNALSIVFLGRRALMKKLTLQQHEFNHMLNILYLTALQTQMEIRQYG